MKKSKEECVEELLEKSKKLLEMCNRKESLFNFLKFTYVFKKLKELDDSYSVKSIKTETGTKLSL